MSKRIITQVRLQAQEGHMRCRVWNENLAAFFVAEPLTIVPDSRIETPASCERESDGPAW